MCNSRGNRRDDVIFERYQRGWEAVHEENDLNKLEEYVLHNPDSSIRAFAFCRLTGWSHWEECDSYSYMSYECGHVDGYSEDRVLWLCDKLQNELGYNGASPGYPMSTDDVLREGAQMVSEQILYGETFCPSVSYVRELAQTEAAGLGVAREGIEFWLLGLLRFAQMEDDEIYYAEFPFSPIIDAQEDAARCRKELEYRRIDAARLEPILRGVLAEGIGSDRVLLKRYFEVVRPRRRFITSVFEAADLLRLVLRCPTDAICQALMRLGLVMTLEKIVPLELRFPRKVPYRPHQFEGNFSTTEVDLSLVDTSAATDLSTMFAGCRKLRSVDLSPLNTSSVEDMYAMFRDCESLQSIDLSPLDTSRVNNLSAAFWYCCSLRSLDFSSWNTSHVIDMSHMLQGCGELEEVNLSGIDTSSVTDTSFMFSDCCALRNIDLSGLDFGHLNNMMGMFVCCTSLERLDLSGLNLSEVEDMSRLFSECSSLVEVNLSDLGTARMVNMTCIFEGCSSLKSVDLRALTSPREIYAGNAFKGCTSLESFGMPECWPLEQERVLPEPTAACGKWWSQVEEKWMSIREIVHRGQCADVLYNSEQ